MTLCYALRNASTSAKRVTGGRKMYFALHAQPEFTVDVRAPFYRNQLAVVENIAKSIPSGYSLVVKDHPAMKGRRPLSFYRELRKLYNVQLVSTALDSHELIEQCDVILTITGSVAWEAILLEKPVVVLSPPCYGFYDQAFVCNHFSDLGAMLSDVLKNFRPDRELLQRFVGALL